MATFRIAVKRRDDKWQTCVVRDGIELYDRVESAGTGEEAARLAFVKACHSLRLDPATEQFEVVPWGEERPR